MARPSAGLAVRLGLAPAVSSRTNMIPGIPAHKRCAERARIVSPLQEWQTHPPACVGSEGHKQQRARVVRTKNKGLYPYTRVRGCASRGHIRAKLVTGFSRSVHKASPAGAGSLLPGRHYACRRKGARSRLAHLPRLPSPLSGRFAPAPGALWGHQSLAGCPPRTVARPGVAALAPPSPLAVRLGLARLPGLSTAVVYPALSSGGDGGLAARWPGGTYPRNACHSGWQRVATTCSEIFSTTREQKMAQ